MGRNVWVTCAGEKRELTAPPPGKEGGSPSPQIPLDPGPASGPPGRPKILARWYFWPSRPPGPEARGPGGVRGGGGREGGREKGGGVVFFYARPHPLPAAECSPPAPALSSGTSSLNVPRICQFFMPVACQQTSCDNKIKYVVIISV